MKSTTYESFSWDNNIATAIALASPILRKPLSTQHTLTTQDELEERRRRDLEHAIKAMLIRHRPDWFISLCFRQVWTGHNRKGYLYHANDTHHDIGEKHLKRWESAIYREMFGRKWSRKKHQLEQVGLEYTYIPEKTGGSGRLHYHLLVRVNPAYQNQFNQVAQKAWLKLIGEWSPVYDHQPQNLQFKEFYQCERISERKGGINRLVGYVTKQARQHTQTFERLGF